MLTPSMLALQQYLVVLALQQYLVVLGSYNKIMQVLPKQQLF
jgi:hypothetical protein